MAIEFTKVHHNVEKEERLEQPPSSQPGASLFNDARYTQEQLSTRKMENLLAVIDDDTLNIEHLSDVLAAVETISRWRLLSIKLHIHEDTLDVIDRNNRGDVQTCLYRALTHWLRLNYDHWLYGRPSWRKLAEAVYSLNYGVFEKIANSHTVTHR